MAYAEARGKAEKADAPAFHRLSQAGILPDLTLACTGLWPTPWPPLRPLRA